MHGAKPVAEQEGELRTALSIKLLSSARSIRCRTLTRLKMSENSKLYGNFPSSIQIHRMTSALSTTAVIVLRYYVLQVDGRSLSELETLSYIFILKASHKADSSRESSVYERRGKSARELRRIP